MTDTNSIWQEAQREARAQTIATERVIPIRSPISDAPLTDEQQFTIALQSTLWGIANMQMLRDKVNVDADRFELIDEAETGLRALTATFRGRVGTRTVLEKLAGMFGRAP
jgi:hypothetical protein